MADSVGGSRSGPASAAASPSSAGSPSGSPSSSGPDSVVSPGSPSGSASAVSPGSPASPVELGFWEGHDVGLDEVDAALRRLRQGEQRAATRTSVVTLVVVAPDDERANRACAAMYRLGPRHPGRTVVIVPDLDARPAIDARVVLHAGEAAGHVLWSEELVLHVNGPAARHLDSLIEPFTLPDLPVAVWFVDLLPEPSDPLTAAADAVLVDARQLPGDDPSVLLAGLVELTRRQVVVDLSWMRLTPWREILANLFTGPAAGCELHVETGEVTGRTGPRHLIGGWLLDRLGLAPEQVRLVPDEHVKILLTTAGAGPSAAGGTSASTAESAAAAPPGGSGSPAGKFLVERRHGEHVVRARVALAGRDDSTQVLALPDDSVPWSLGFALGRLQRDPVYEHALLGALSLTT